MKQLRNGNKNILQDYRKNHSGNGAVTVLRPLAFLVKAQESDGSLRIYNVLTGAAVMLDKKEAETFGRVKTEAADASSKNTAKLLAEEMFLVPEDFNEYDYVDDLRFLHACRDRVKDEITKYYIYPTTGCNARCFYCFEEGIAARSMSRNTAIKTAEYIIRKSKHRPVIIRWFGGEPTLGMDAIRTIYKRLEAAGIRSFAKMNTNGFLLDEKLIGELKGYNVGIVQIPVDGTGKTYNNIKNYVGIPESVSPWETILKNTEEMLRQGIQVDIRLNIGMHNRDDVINILEELIRNFGRYEKFTVFPQVLNEGGTCSYTDKERNGLFEIQKKAYEYCLDRGITISQNRYSLPGLVLHSCKADESCWVGISPEGNIYKCPENINNELYFTDTEGSFETHENYDVFYEKQNWERCRSCEFYPSCVNLKECCARQKECQDCHRDFRHWKTERILKEIQA